MKNSHCIGELEVERLLLREPNDGRVRAVLETGPPGIRSDPEGVAPNTLCVRLTLLSPGGDVALLAEVDQCGVATVVLGNPDEGPATIIAPAGLDVWASGNVVASLRSTSKGGQLELLGVGGEQVRVP